MELNICLYCEKRLQDESAPFCSMDCQMRESSKATTTGDHQRLYYQCAYCPPSANARAKPPASPMSSLSRYELSYHQRRRSILQPDSTISTVSSSSSLQSMDSPSLFHASSTDSTASSLYSDDDRSFYSCQEKSSLYPGTPQPVHIHSPLLA
ncbi:hypothetical protein BCR43DRAFT_490973 [Syncephalastrum racemosum]|uniref:Uncharacterized protein n=1 Tax=Syncephalastrum racemosum TaxID=13706 RepID=A0A1X2HGU3_SYNRA|nr:hypothetical protein BCR43DRAFT_490973 [Syncephalastrum racemosum]